MPRGRSYVLLLLDEEYEAEILGHEWIIKRYPAVPGAASVREVGEWTER